MTSPVDIRPDHLEVVQGILREYLPVDVKVWVFGSRANWSTKDSSDLDLALEGESRLSHKLLGTLKDAFDDSALPYTVDVVDLNRIGDSFRQIVESQRTPLLLDGDGANQRVRLAAPLTGRSAASGTTRRRLAMTAERHLRAGWREALWGDLATLEYGKSLRDYNSSDGRHRVYGTNGPIGWHSEPLCHEASVIIGRKGAYRGVHYSPDPFFVIDTAFYLQPKVELDTRWAYYQLLTVDINGMDSGSAIPSTSREDFYGLPVEVPPLVEQRAIAHVLGTLDDKIELNRRMNETLEAMARALFKSWFVDFAPVRAKMEGRWRQGESLPDLYDLFPDRLVDSELGEIPEGWGVRALGDCFNLTMGQSPPGSTYNDDGNGTPFYQGSTDFGARYPTNRRYCTKPARLAQTEDTLVSVRAPVGAINRAWERCCIGRGVAALRHKSGSAAYTYYAIWAAQPEIGQYEHTGTVFGAIGGQQFRALLMLEPHDKTVAAFHRIGQDLDSRIRSNVAESRALAMQRDSLLPKLVSGEIQTLGQSTTA